VRRHVKRVRRIGRDRGISARRLEAEFGRGGIVHRVNDVVRDARMVGVTRQHAIQNLATLLLPGIALIGGIQIPHGHQLQRVKDRRVPSPRGSPFVESQICTCGTPRR